MSSRKGLLESPEVREVANLSCEMIDRYCRVMEMHIKVVEQAGISPLGQKQKNILDLATSGLERELTFLSFLAGGADETDG